MIPSLQKPVTVLYLGSLTHSDQTNFLDKTKPHEDEIDFHSPARITLIRIPRPGKDIYSRHISITQSQTIKNFEIYYRNLEKTSGRYSLLSVNSQLLVSSNDDILITPKQPVIFLFMKIFTDLLLIKGNFTKITLCIYGNLVTEELTLSQKCPNYLANAPIQPITQNLIQMYFFPYDSKKDIFHQKLSQIHQLYTQTIQQNSIQQWPSIQNDDGINQQEIQHISRQSDKLMSTINNQKLSQQEFVVEFRSGLQEISSNLAKIFKNKHLGLYYPQYDDSSVENDLSISVTQLALCSLELSLSEQVRGLEMLKFMLQLERHVGYFVENNGVEKLIKIYVDFFKLNTVVLSTYKNLILQVLICLSHWKKAALKMTSFIESPYYHEIFEQKVIIQQKLSQQRQRSRQKQRKTKRSRSQQDSESSGDQNKKKKKDKQKRRNKSRERKKGKQSKIKEQLVKKISEQKQKQKEKQEPKTLSLRQQLPTMSFYQVLLFQLCRQKSIKQLTLIKLLLQQILQTVTKSKASSQRVSLSTSLLKDIKYIFNPAGQVLNTKSLKQFASCYQPFLNNVQSQGVKECEFIAEREKLKDMRKWDIEPRVCKMLNRLSLELAADDDSETRTPYNQRFIVTMSQLTRSQSNSVLYCLSRLLNSFRLGSSNDIIYLKKIEAAMTMISQYIYKILVQDDGLYTVLNIDQIYTSLINITNCLSKDPSAFTKELKRKIRQLTNYAMAYDLFNRSEGNFKAISDYFLRLFKFQHYEINKISEYKKKEFQKSIEPFSITNLSDTINLGSFHELFPEQPLLQIDVYLKIFIMVLQYNRNVWPLFYQNKLVCGFSVLFIKLSNMVRFLLVSTLQREAVLCQLKKSPIVLQNYLSVLSRLLTIMVKKAQYESAFNDLIDQDNFQNVEVYEHTLTLYVQLFNAVNSSQSLVTSKGKKLAKQILAMILELYDKLMESYELTSHGSREGKVKELWMMIYQKHFVQVRSRAACISLMKFLTESAQNATIKLFNTCCFDESIKSQHLTQCTKGHVPVNNDKSMIQNLILANIFRSDHVIQNNLSLLIKALLGKHSQKNPMVQKVTAILEGVFDQVEVKVREKGAVYQGRKDLVVLEKMVLLTDLLKRIQWVLTMKFQEKLLKHLRFIDCIKQSEDQQNKFQQAAYKSALKIKASIISFLKKSFAEKPEHSQLLNFIQLIGKNLDFSGRLLKAIEGKNLGQMSQMEMEVQNQALNLTNISLEAVCACSSNPYNQSVILYEVFLEKPYKPVPQLTLSTLLNNLSTPELSQFVTSDDMQLQNIEQTPVKNTASIKNTTRQIVVRMTYFLCLLTSIDSVQFYSTESRRNAITCLVTDQKDFPFSKLQQFRHIIPAQFLQTLKDYFAYPIVEKPLTIKIEQKKQTLKNKGYLFSKAMFTIVMQGELTAKSRYQYIGGSWKGGDVKTGLLYTPIKEREYLSIVTDCFKPEQKDAINRELFDRQSVTNYQKAEMSPISLNTSNFFIKIEKRTRLVEKKQTVESQVKLLNIPLVLQYQPTQQKGDQTAMLKRVSPSPSNKFTGGYPKSSSYDGKAKVSPSPPSGKTSGQNVIGFGGLGHQASGQYGGQQLMPGQLQQQPMSNIPVQSIDQQHIQPGMQQQWTSPTKQDQYGGNSIPQKLVQPPIYPNPYYSMPVQKTPEQLAQGSLTVSTLPYLQMQKVNSQDSTGNIRSGSGSAPRSNVPYGTGMGTYPPQNQQYYGSTNQYPSGGGKVYDNRSHSPYQKQYSQNQQYNQGQRREYPQQQGGYYPQGQGNFGNYPQRQQGYQQNRQYNQSYNYQYQQRNTQQSYPPQPQTQFPPQQSYPQYNEQQRLFNQAILLVTQLRGTLPQPMKADKKNRLNVILHSNLRVQNRVKEYISGLK